MVNKTQVTLLLPNGVRVVCYTTYPGRRALVEHVPMAARFVDQRTKEITLRLPTIIEDDYD